MILNLDLGNRPKVQGPQTISILHDDPFPDRHGLKSCHLICPKMLSRAKPHTESLFVKIAGFPHTRGSQKRTWEMRARWPVQLLFPLWARNYFCRASLWSFLKDIVTVLLNFFLERCRFKIFVQ